ncbi:MAG: RtcB family protein [Patescibacteria group bacterium]
MISKKDFRKISDWLWEIPKNFRKGMRVPARIYVDEKMLDDALQDRSVEQLINLTFLPGIQKYSLALPDVHEGYASPIGGVAAIKAEDGVISPGVCGYDINCGMKLLKSDYSEEDLNPFLEDLASQIQREVPSGLGQGRKIKLGIRDIDRILEQGAKELVEQGYGVEEDLENCESNGRLSFADASCVSNHAKERGRDQIGTLGSGNHFLEIQKVKEVFNEKAAKAFGLFLNQVVVMIHTGSRGLGHQIATDYLRMMMPAMERYKISVPDREFACVPFNSKEGQRYFSAMACGANFAWSNRQMIAYFVRKSWRSVLGKNNPDLTPLYDVAHNIIKKEKYLINKKEIEVIVHRKGATRAFPPQSQEIPKRYREFGQPVLIPGSMGTASYVLIGRKKGEESFFSACHGSGRTMSRHAAMKQINASKLIEDLEQKGILVKHKGLRGIAEEAPQAYKNVEDVVNVVHQAGLAEKVVKLVPLAVIKGE